MPLLAPNSGFGHTTKVRNTPKKLRFSGAFFVCGMATVVLHGTHPGRRTSIRPQVRPRMCLSSPRVTSALPFHSFTHRIQAGVSFRAFAERKQPPGLDAFLAMRRHDLTDWCLVSPPETHLAVGSPEKNPSYRKGTFFEGRSAPGSCTSIRDLYSGVKISNEFFRLSFLE